MKIFCFNVIICLIALSSCNSQTSHKQSSVETTDHKFTNELINETSPYLLQHAHNPVNWYPWGEKALEKAKKENKLLIISVGYAACHWCHVMEHESFENEEVAKFMNDNFVAIKVDREERPDIDQVYINAVQLLTGRAGWPLNCVALPDGRPLYGGTYFPKKQWIDVLSQVSNFVKKNPEKAESEADKLTRGIQSSEQVYLNTEEAIFSESDLDLLFNTWKGRFDKKEGGYEGSPKFPLPAGYQFLLQYHYLSKNEEALEAVNLTLDKMANGGIYDQIGGGFSRYSTDAYWKAPHFEKMLYDNSQLVSLYSNAYKQTKDPKYKTIVEETLEFIKRELTSEEGGFYASLDADSEGEEGKFYVWKQKELDQILGKEANLIKRYYNVERVGNWENGQNILFKSDNEQKLMKRYDLTLDQLNEKVLKAKKVLLKERTKRIRPNLDDKIITAWNGLMIKAYAEAYQAFGNKEYLKTALTSANFITEKLRSSDHRLDRNYKNGKSTINAFLDDYAFTIDAFITLYQVTFDEQWLKKAKDLTAYALTHFYDEKNAVFFYTSDIDPSLVARKMEVSDNVIPSSNSQMAKNLFTIGHYFYNDKYISESKKMLNNVKSNAIAGGTYYANWDILMAWFISPPNEVAIIGKDFESKRKELSKNYLPNVFLSGGKKEGSLELLKGKLIKGETTIYVCQEKACKLPVNDINLALKQIE